MRKRVIGLGLAALLVAASSVTAMAEDRQGAEGWQVRFDGKTMESSFTSGNMADEINLMQPGDSVELTITLKNDFDGQADWYMKNEVLSTLEDAGDAAGGAYDYLLTYTDTAGETTTLYSSEKFGGEGRINGVGLHGATTSLDDYFYLDRMGEGGEGIVKLKVALDGETLVNDYQNTFARLQMDFATELVQTEIGIPTGPDNNTPGGGTDNPNGGTPGNPGGSNGGAPGGGEVVKTGDQTTFMASMAAMLVAGLVIMVIVVVRLRREQTGAAVDAGAGRSGNVIAGAGAGRSGNAVHADLGGVSRSEGTRGSGKGAGPGTQTGKRRRR